MKFQVTFQMRSIMAVVSDWRSSSATPGGAVRPEAPPRRCAISTSGAFHEVTSVSRGVTIATEGLFARFTSGAHTEIRCAAKQRGSKVHINDVTSLPLSVQT